MNGVRLQGGFEASISWEQRQVNKLLVTSHAGQTFVLKSEQKIKVIDAAQNEKHFEPIHGFIEIPMEKDTKYQLLFPLSTG